MQENRHQMMITQFIDIAERELYRFKYSASTVDQHRKEFHDFTEYCSKKGILTYSPDTGTEYFFWRYGLDMTDETIKHTWEQKQTWSTLRLLDDIFVFGYARHYRNCEYVVPEKYIQALDKYLDFCVQSNGAAGTIRVKRTKLLQFLCFLDRKQIELSGVTASVISEYMTTLFAYSRATISITSSVLREFFRYLYAVDILPTDLSGDVPRPKIYVEEDVPETWTSEEIRQLLNAIGRSSAIGKRDYAMVLLAAVLGMRAGDICALQFKNIDWHRKLINYTQQKTGKDNSLPLLPLVGEAIIDYLKNGRLDSECNNVFIRHIPPYGPIGTGSTLSESIKRYMRKASIPTKKRKLSHAMRHTLASSLLSEGVPLMMITNIMGHDTPQTTVGYIKVDITSLRKCALSYGTGGCQYDRDAVTG